MGGVGAWGPIARGGRGRRWPRFLVAALLSGAVAAVGATASVASITYGAVTQNIERTEVAGLEVAEPNEPLYVLVVGSDERDGLTREERNDLTLGVTEEFAGARSDTVLLVSISADRQSVSVVSFPRDLVVEDSDGGIAKLTETYNDGRAALVRAVQEDLGFPVNHYVEVSISGFIETVRVVGSVEVCLDEPLRDTKSGADLDAGCQDLEPVEALAYVRSRQGPFGDFERIERQQRFLRGLIAEILDARLLLDPGRFVAVAEEVSGNLTVDDELTVPMLLELSQQLRGALTGDVTMATVPGFATWLDDDGLTKSFVVAYDPGRQALVDTIEADEELESRGTPEDREEISVRLLTGGRTAGAAVLESTLSAGGFTVDGGIVTGEVDGGEVTTVYEVPGHEEHAAWIAAFLGGEVGRLPVPLDAPEGVTALVAVGDDAEQAAIDAPPSLEAPG